MLIMVGALFSFVSGDINEVVTLRLNFSNQTLFLLPDNESCIEEGMMNNT